MCSKSYSYSRSRGYTTFPYSYLYSRRVQIGDFLSKFHGNNTHVSVQNIIFNEIYLAELNTCLKFYISVSIIICLYAFPFFCGEEIGCMYLHVYKLYKLYTHMYTRGENTYIYTYRYNN